MTANDYPGMPTTDRRYWAQTLKIYETLSRWRTLPVVGPALFGLMDAFQRIAPFYPRRDLSHPTLQLREIYRLISHDGLGKHLIDKLSATPVPFVTTFFIPAFAAELHGYPGDIYCVICDADISRAWAPLDPRKSRIRYFAPNGRVVERLKLYGVPAERIYLTGFPLPMENIGGADGTIVKQDLAERICNLDPEGIFSKKYAHTLRVELGPALCTRRSHHPLTLTFSVGGAGAQKEIASDMLSSLREKILRKKIRVNLEAGTRPSVARFFLDHIRELGLSRALGSGIMLHAYASRPAYFAGFAKTLRTTDILWTKPSELSFYAGLGLPIIMAPPLGSQENFNKVWLQTVNGGLEQLDPRHTDEWLFDWIASGGLARFAWNGYIEAPTHGAYRIEGILSNTTPALASLPLII